MNCSLIDCHKSAFERGLLALLLALVTIALACKLPGALLVVGALATLSPRDRRVAPGRPLGVAIEPIARRVTTGAAMRASIDLPDVVVHTRRSRRATWYRSRFSRSDGGGDIQTRTLTRSVSSENSGATPSRNSGAADVRRSQDA